MSGRTPRPLIYATGGAVATVILIAVTVFLATHGIETASKVAGIISMFVGISSLSVAIWNARQGRRAQLDKAAASETTPALETSSGTTPMPRTGSDIKIGKVRATHAFISDGNTTYFGPVSRDVSGGGTKAPERN